MSGIFRELLGVAVGVNENFFESGGHSLLAMRLIAAISDRLRVELPLISVFEAPSIRGLAARVVAQHAESVPAPAKIPRLPRGPAPVQAP